MELELIAPQAGQLQGEILLNGSKSISNRLLIIYALCQEHFEIHNLSNAHDTVTLARLLSNEREFLLDAGDAGTTFRFMTAYLAFRPKRQVLTGSARMLERPIGALVDALRSLGAQICYLRKEGYPPLQLACPLYNGNNTVKVAAHISSQFITALLLIAPTLPKGLAIYLQGETVSEAYIQLTLDLMQEFGIRYFWNRKKKHIYIAPQAYKGKNYHVESDWSAASYYYAMVALAPNPESGLILGGLSQYSSQGDACLLVLMRYFGVESYWDEQGKLHLHKSRLKTGFFEYDFIQCPDIAQTVAVVCAALHIPALLTGLQTLKIKETDRLSALKTELEKLGASIHISDHSLEVAQGVDYTRKNVLIRTYKDHRMAMAFAPLCLLLPNIRFEDKNVVVKSYPNFWKDLQEVGFQLKTSKEKDPAKGQNNPF